MQRGLGITQECNVGNAFFASMDKRSRGKKQQEKTEKWQYVIVTVNNLFKGFTTEDERNCNQKQSGKLDSGIA